MYTHVFFFFFFLLHFSLCVKARGFTLWCLMCCDFGGWCGWIDEGCIGGVAELMRAALMMAGLLMAALVV